MGTADGVVVTAYFALRRIEASMTVNYALEGPTTTWPLLLKVVPKALLALQLTMAGLGQVVAVLAAYPRST